MWCDGPTVAGWSGRWTEPGSGGGRDDLYTRPEVEKTAVDDPSTPVNYMTKRRSRRVIPVGILVPHYCWAAS